MTTRMTERDQIRGMFLGIAIGDALGMSVEGFSAEKIKEKYERVTSYHEPTGHKWFDGEPAGKTTDDTQLTLAVAAALLESGLSIQTQVEKHVEAFRDSTHGWGYSTKEGVRNLANGISWFKSATGKGLGNGVAMKIAPLAAWTFLIDKQKNFTLDQKNQLLETVVDFGLRITVMTHDTVIGVASAWAQFFAVLTCLDNDEDWKKKFITRVQDGAALASYSHGNSWSPDEESDKEEDDLSVRLLLLDNYEEYNPERTIKEFGEGSCYVYNSLPFTYMFFLKNPHSIDSLYDVVSAGGDTDTNGSMLGACLGALNGDSIFPDHLIEGLVGKDQVLEMADRFYDAFLK